MKTCELTPSGQCALSGQFCGECKNFAQFEVLKIARKVVRIITASQGNVTPVMERTPLYEAYLKTTSGRFTTTSAVRDKDGGSSVMASVTNGKLKVEPAGRP